MPADVAAIRRQQGYARDVERIERRQRGRHGRRARDARPAGANSLEHFLLPHHHGGGGTAIGDDVERRARDEDRGSRSDVFLHRPQGIGRDLHIVVDAAVVKPDGIERQEPLQLALDGEIGRKHNDPDRRTPAGRHHRVGTQGAEFRVPSFLPHVVKHSRKPAGYRRHH